MPREWLAPFPEGGTWRHGECGGREPDLPGQAVRGHDVLGPDRPAVAKGAAILDLGQSVVEIGGCPLAEHGVGRHPAKQELLRLLYGADGVTAMRGVKRALDPEGRLAPGVIFATQ